MNTYLIKHPPFLGKYVKKELTRHHATIIDHYAGSYIVHGDPAFLSTYSMASRLSSRIMLLCDRFEQIHTFDDLFDAVGTIDRSRYIQHHHSISVRVHSHQHPLYATRSIQSITHKAILGRLSHDATGQQSVEVFINLGPKDVSIWIDTSGDALYKRGYRTYHKHAHLKEHIAAGLVLSSGRRHRQNLYDPCCGTGTIPIEAALIAKNIAPNKDRHFVFQDFVDHDSDLHNTCKQALTDKEYHNHSYNIQAYDKDPFMISTAKRHAQQAGVADCIHFDVSNIHHLQVEERSHIVTNPPYGERLMKSEEEAIARLYRRLLSLYQRPDVQGAFITSYPLSLSSSQRKKENRRNGPLDIIKRSTK